MDEIDIHPMKKLRKELGISQTDVSVGTLLSLSTIRRAEDGHGLDRAIIALICEYFAEKHGLQITAKELGLKEGRKNNARISTIDYENKTELGTIEQELKSEMPLASLSRPNEWIIPLPPSAYLAHPYPLQENFTGRHSERQMLIEWLIDDQRPILSLVALGGMGKSSLTWTWLQQDVLNLSQSHQLEGIMWWSFYEAEAYFVTFLNQALIYMSSGTINPKNISSTYEKMQSLLSLLQQQRFLIIFDGFERQIRAYSGIDIASYDDATTDTTQKTFRLCVDPHVGSFLRWAAAGNMQSKILLSSRLSPQELDGLVGCRHERLQALHTEDAISFLRAQGVQGTRTEIQAACTFYGNHPLTLRLLAGVIVYDPARPGDIAVATDYNLLPEIIQREHHILTFAYEALHSSLQQLLSQLSAFRSLVDFKTIKAVSHFVDERVLKAALRELIDRGFIFFDRSRGHYDLHPVVRQYSYSRLQRKEEVHARLADYFQSMITNNVSNEPIEKLNKIRVLFAGVTTENDHRVTSIEDLSPTIELFHHIVFAKDFEKAFRIYYYNLAAPLYHQLGAYQTVIELLQAFFSPDEIFPPEIENNQQSWILDALANAYSASGYPQRAVQLLQRSIKIDQGLNDKESLASTMWIVAVQQLELGELAASERNLQESISICQNILDAFNEAKAHQYFALLKAYQGKFEESTSHLDRAMVLFKKVATPSAECTVWAYRSLCSLISRDYQTASYAARKAYELADTERYERDIIRAKWLLGLACIQLFSQEKTEDTDLLKEAELHLREAIDRCRRIDMVDYEADLLLSWARIHFVKGNTDQAKAHAIEALAITDRSDFRVLRADIYNFIAQIYLSENNILEATSSARQALSDAICDGPPYSYVSALQDAQALIEHVKNLS